MVVKLGTTTEKKIVRYSYVEWNKKGNEQLILCKFDAKIKIFALNLRTLLRGIHKSFELLGEEEGRIIENRSISNRT